MGGYKTHRLYMKLRNAEARSPAEVLNCAASDTPASAPPLSSSATTSVEYEMLAALRGESPCELQEACSRACAPYWDV